MKSKKNSVGKTVRNILVAGALGLSVFGGINQSYAQESNTPSQDRAANPQKYDTNERLKADIEEAKKQGKVLTRRENNGAFVITHPKYGSIEVKNLSEYVSTMANYMKGSQDNIVKGVSVLESELQRGYLSPERAKEAKTSLVEAIKDYEYLQAMYGNLHYNNGSRFKRDVDFFASDVREELVDTDTKERVPYPGKMFADFAEFAKKNQLEGESKSGYNTNPYNGEVGKPLTKALEELDDVIKKEVQQELKTRRYVPWSGFGERIDEFVHPGVGDGWEIGVTMAAILAVAGSGIGYIMYRVDKADKKKEQEKKKDEAPKQVINEPDPEQEIINPWDINVNNLNSGGKR